MEFECRWRTCFCSVSFTSFPLSPVPYFIIPHALLYHSLRSELISRPIWGQEDILMSRKIEKKFNITRRCEYALF